MAHICWVERGFGIIVIQIHLVPYSIRSQECRVVSGVHQHHRSGRVRIKLICTPRMLVSWSHLGMTQCKQQEQSNSKQHLPTEKIYFRSLPVGFLQNTLKGNSKEWTTNFEGSGFPLTSSAECPTAVKRRTFALG